MKAKQPRDQLQVLGDIAAGNPKENNVKLALLNVRSLNNEQENVSRLLREKNLVVFLLTETWLTNKTADEELKKAFSPHYVFYYKLEEVKQGRGVAIIVLWRLESEPVEGLPTTETFQYVAIKLKRKEWTQHVLIINVYRPPGAFKLFLNEFKMFLEEVIKRDEEVILTGDFNIPNSPNFEDLLREKKLNQLVTDATHKNGNILDLVISHINKFYICDLRVDDGDDSLNTDPNPVYFSIMENEAKQTKTEKASK